MRPAATDTTEEQAAEIESTRVARILSKRTHSVVREHILSELIPQRNRLQKLKARASHAFSRFSNRARIPWNILAPAMQEENTFCSKRAHSLGAYASRRTSSRLPYRKRTHSVVREHILSELTHPVEHPRACHAVREHILSQERTHSLGEYCYLLSTHPLEHARTCRVACTELFQYSVRKHILRS